VEAALDLKRLRDLEDRYLERIDRERRQTDELINVVVPAGVALSAEKDFTRLLERILLEAKGFCNADGGTLYLKNDSDQLEFMMFHNDSMGIRLGGTTGQPVRFPPLDLHDPDSGAPNHSNVATFAALSGRILNIPDAGEVEDFDFSGARRFDEAHGYHSISFLTLPLQNVHGRTLGVLQLVNALDRRTGRVIPFSAGSQRLMTSFSLLATVAIDSYTRTQGLRQELQHLRAELDRVRRAR
jgi:GAF domain-containing protein